MTTIEIISGAVLLLSCVLIIIAVSLQSNRGEGLTSVIMGGDSSTGRAHEKDKDARLASATKVLAIILFVVTLAVNIITLASKN